MKLAQQSTIYNYTLARRIRLGSAFGMGYACLLGLLVMAAIWRYGLLAGASLPIDLALLIVLHRLVIRSILRYSVGASSTVWKMTLAFPLIAFVPVSFIPAGQWFRLTTHLLVVGLVLPCLLYVWLAPVWWVPGIGLHLWLLLPLLRIRYGFRGLRKPGFLRFQGSECSYYYS